MLQKVSSEICFYDKIVQTLTRFIRAPNFMSLFKFLGTFLIFRFSIILMKFYPVMAEILYALYFINLLQNYPR